jgi:RNA polymerase sigma-70 factor (ECF subfamily)
VWSDDLIEKLRNRDMDAFESLYNTFRNRIYGYLFVKTGRNGEIASDLLHETFASALDSAHTLRNGSNVSSWLYTIASRRFTDYLRAKYKSNETANIDDYIIASDENTEDECARQEEISFLYCALERIKDKYRDIIELKYFKEMTEKEIAKRYGKGVKAVESLLVRAREALRREMLRDHSQDGER